MTFVARDKLLKAFFQAYFKEKIFIGVRCRHFENTVARHNAFQRINSVLVRHGFICPSEIHSLIRVDIRRHVAVLYVVSVAHKGERARRRPSRLNVISGRVPTVHILRTEVVRKLVCRRADCRQSDSYASVFADVRYAHDFNSAGKLRVRRLARSVNLKTMSRRRTVFIIDKAALAVLFAAGMVISRIEDYNREVVRSDYAVAVVIVFFEVDIFIAGADDVVNCLCGCRAVVIAFEIAKSRGVRKRHGNGNDARLRHSGVGMIYLYRIKPEFVPRHFLIKIHHRTAIFAEKSVKTVIGL